MGVPKHEPHRRRDNQRQHQPQTRAQCPLEAIQLLLASICESVGSTASEMAIETSPGAIG
jgi:hypothetical protein